MKRTCQRPACCFPWPPTLTASQFHLLAAQLPHKLNCFWVNPPPDLLQPEVFNLAAVSVVIRGSGAAGLAATLTAVR